MAKSEQQLKIGFILDGGLDKPDGVQQYILALGNYFESLGHQIRYIVAGKVPDNIANVYSFSNSISVKSNGNKLSIPLLASKKKIKNFLAKEYFDVLHVQVPYSPLMAERFIFLKDNKTALIGTFHIIPNNKLLVLGDKLLGKWCYFSLKKFDQMLSVSYVAKEVCKRDFKTDSLYLPNVLNFSNFNEAKSSIKPSGKLRILFFGRLVPRKGAKLLLEAINILINSDNELPEFEVIIAGQGPLKKDLESYVIKNNLENIVKFLGFIEEIDKPGLYASSDLSIFPANGGESFGIVLLEAMASGKAAILAGNNAGYASVLRDKPELLFDPYDANNLAHLIKEYLIDNKKRLEVASWGEKFASNFDVQVVGNKLLDIYRDNVYKRKEV